VNSLSNLYLNESELVASICRESYYEFVKEFWDVLTKEKPVWNWHIKYLCNEIQYLCELVFVGKDKEDDLVINIFPGETKSTICSIMLAPWCWTRMPHLQFIGGSHQKGLSIDFGKKSRDIVLSDKYRACFPEIQLRQDQCGRTFHQNTKGGWRYATSTGAGVTGMHGHIISIDDPIDPQGACSDVEIKNANDWIRDTLSQRKVNQAKTPTILVMQRLHQEDPTAYMIDEAKKVQKIERQEGDENAPLRIKHICLPSEKTKDIKPKILRKYYKNGLMDEIRGSQKILNEKKAKGDYFYAGQFLQNPIPAGGGMFKVERIKIDVPESNSILRKVRFWDKAGTEGAGAFTAGVQMGVDRKNRFWILDLQRGQWAAEVRESRIKQCAEIDGREDEIGIEQEPGSGGKDSAEMTVKNLAGWKVVIDKPSGAGSSKIARARPFSVQVNIGNVSMIKASWNVDLINELQFWPFSTYKDIGDGCSGAFNMLTAKKRAGVFLRR
jgi:predicted phage terminase large subunit-like protein